MAPKKTNKNSKQMKKSTASIEIKPLDFGWWNVFWQKNSSAPGLVIPRDEDEGFKYFFRMSKKTFEYICSLVREVLICRPPNSGLKNIEGKLLSVENQVAIALRRLASGDSQVSVGISFGVDLSTVSIVTWRFVEALEERGRHHLKWPDSCKLAEIKLNFEKSFGLPNCCGAIGATHIVMTLPVVESSGDWQDNVQNNCMFCQGTVDPELRFLDIVTGWSRGLSTSRLLEYSGFYKLCQGSERLNGLSRTLSEGVEVQEFIVGGTDYPLLPWLITPYRKDDWSCISDEFTAAHNAARLLAVKAFSNLKGSWKILNKVMREADKDKLPKIVVVCCFLHNIIIDCGDSLLHEVPLSGHDDSECIRLLCKQVDPLGKTMRDNLAKHLQLIKQKAQLK
ncbi:protein ANTAGONIST OF LIKE HETEROCHROMATIN PROTEIN 1-like [Apium graveolens]|uniref:protein ANTAGONIST OF LIKE HETEROCHROMATIN PROTEIN 1-like n=1 Tax=Apium graveolens TaxID=4045 RepID=UPI003D7A8917